MSDPQQSIDVSGSNNRIDVAGRDINYFQAEPDFVTPDLDAYAPPRYERHRIAVRLVKLLTMKRLVILGGDARIDKTSLARHLARNLTSHLGSSSIDVKEWRRGSTLASLTTAIQEAADPTLFLFMDVTARDVPGGPSQMSLAAAGQHYVIVTTKADKHAWRLEADEEDYWQDLTVEEVYDASLLGKKLRAQLQAFRDALPAPFDPTVPLEAPLVGRWSLQDIAADLETPRQITAFVHLLLRETGPINEPTINTLIVKATNPSTMVRQSYQELSRVDQRLTALAFSMFSGLMDDQVFAAVERVYEQAWRVRKPDLSMPDYCDVEFLRETLFDFTETDSGATALVEQRFEDQRKVLIDAAWEIDRRQMLGALGVLTRLVFDSVAPNAGVLDRDLFGTREQRRYLRDAVANTISDLGRKSPGVVEESLLSLAASEDVGVQSVAARAMARWREHGLDAPLFEQLKRWHEGANSAKVLRVLLQGWERQLKAQPEDYLRATVALTLGYAAQYDNRNDLKQEIVDALLPFAGDSSAVVRGAFRNGTLPLIVSAHAIQLKDKLREMTEHLYLVDPIAQSLGRAYRSDPEAIWDLLDDWFRDAKARKPAAEDAFDDIARESLLATVVLAYAFIPVESPQAGMATDRLRDMLSVEHHPIVREAVIITISRLASRDSGQFTDMLRQIIDGMRSRDLDGIADELTRVFVDERAELPGGDGYLEFRNVQFPVWMDQDRPLTDIEETLLSWLDEDDCSELTRELVLKCSLQFEDLLHEPEQARIRELREQRLQQEEEDEEDPRAIEPEAEPAPRFSWAAKWVSFFNSPRDYATLRGLLSQAVVYKNKQEVLDSVLDRWQEHPNPEVGRLAELLRKTLKRHAVFGS
jgi:hypothetical protein